MQKHKLLFLCLLSLFALRAQIPSNGLIGQWEFSGNANDASGSANHGIVNSASLTTDRCGHPNSAYNFNGTSSYIHMSQAGPPGAQPRSVSFWAKTNKSAISANDIMAVFGYGEFANAKGWSIHYNYNCVGIGCDVHNEAYTCGASCLTDNDWHHIAIVFNTTLSASFGPMVYYVDGVQLPGISCVITGTSQTVNTGTVLPIEIGKVHDDVARYFQGCLDDFYLYNRPLSGAEVQQLYYACVPAVSGPSLVCRNGSGYVYSVPLMPGATSYTWNLPGGWSGNSSTNTITAIPGVSVGSGTMQVMANNSCGGLPQKSAVKTVAVVSDCVGVDEFEPSAGRVTVFPNPSLTGEFTIKATGPSQIRVVNIFGQVVMEGCLSPGNNLLSLKEQCQGVYFLAITYQNNKATFKLMIE